MRPCGQRLGLAQIQKTEGNGLVQLGLELFLALSLHFSSLFRDIVSFTMKLWCCWS
jgi:hypothetical protein